jgi:drug/metabolite transporter (DMT)-like permease
MDDSVELFHAEQERRAHKDEPIREIGRAIVLRALAVAVFFALMWVVMSGLSTFPRNSDNSMRVVFYGPVFGLLALASILFLRLPRFRKSPFRTVAWMLMLLALVAIPVGIYDEVMQFGR